MKNKIKNSKDVQGANFTKTLKPVIFDISSIASLFFTESGVNHLVDNELLHIPDVKTIDNEPADIIMGLSPLEGEYFELKLVLTTTHGVERLTIYDTLKNLNSFQLKKWMHIGLCHEGQKKELISKCPEEYSFDSTLRLAQHVDVQ